MHFLNHKKDDFLSIASAAQMEQKLIWRPVGDWQADKQV